MPGTTLPLRGGLCLLIAALVVGALLSSGVAAAAGDGTAPSYRVDGAHTAVQVDPALQLPLSQRWSVALGDAVSYPLVVDGKVFVTASNYPGSATTLYALDQVDGHVIWSQPIPGTYWWSAAAYDNGKVFVVNFDGLLRTFSAADGSPLWSTALTPQYVFTSPPTAAGGIVYVSGAGNGGTLYAVDESNGAILARQSVANGDDSSPTLSDTQVFVSYACNQAYGFTRPTLGFLWHHSTFCSGGGGATTVYSSGRVFTQDYYGNLMLDAATGVELGTWGPRGDSLPAVDGQTMWILSGGSLVARSVTTGVTLWSFAGDGNLYGDPLVVDNGTVRYVVTTSRSGMIYAVDAATGASLLSIAGPAFSSTGHGVPEIGLAAGQGLLVVPVGNHVTAYATGTTAPQTISFPPIPTHLVDQYNDAPADTVSATSSAGLLVTVASTTPGVCTVANPVLAGGVSTWTLTVTAIGTCSLTATQAGNGSYLPATPVTQSFQVARQFVLGPQAMEGDLKVAPGTTLRVGFAFSIPGKHPATTVSFVAAKVVFSYTCTKGTNTGTFTVPIPDILGTAVGVNDTAWIPAGTKTNPSTFQAALPVPNVCPTTGSQVRLRQGGTFSAGVTSTGTNKINVHWHYSATTSGGNWSTTGSVTP